MDRGFHINDKVIFTPDAKDSKVEWARSTIFKIVRVWDDADNLQVTPLWIPIINNIMHPQEIQHTYNINKNDVRVITPDEEFNFITERKENYV